MSHEVNELLHFDNSFANKSKKILKTKYLDNFIVKKKLVSKKFQYIPRTKIPLPSEVEISESGTCNRKCSFCPRSAPSFEDIKEFISKDLVNKISTELSELDYKGVVRFSGFVEPMLDKKIFDHIDYIFFFRH